ncbi:MAG: CoA pyrophosphatase [candidate division NC10 bacterium]|nr:CoA pyrophosphatase [candidate division NC10 bacterium]
MTSRLSPLQEAVAAILQGRPSREVAREGYRRAAVLLPLFEAAAGPHLLLCRRTESVPTHKGQISFPGGGRQPEDADMVATALREAYEEVGLHPADVTVLGLLDENVTVNSRHVVRPVVGAMPHPYPLALDPFEIVEAISLPLLPLLNGAPFREETWERGGRLVPVLFYEHAGHIVWGLTARILQDFVTLVQAPLRARGLTA